MHWLRLLPAATVLLAGLSALAAGQPPVAPPPIEDLPARRAPFRQPGLPGQPGGPTTNLSDEEALKQAQLSPTDGPKLLEYLKQRTLSDSEEGRIADIIKRFAADDFDDRVLAAEEIEGYGPAAVGPLKKAEKDSDPEVAYRARTALRKLEKVPHAAVTAAAVRAVVKLKPEGAAAVLIGYLPVADTEPVAETIREALVALAAPGGKAEPALVAALADPSPVRRAAAYVALTEGGDAGARVRIKDAYPQVRTAVLADPDPEAKFAGLWALTLVTREKEYVPELIGLIPKLSRGRLWQLEDLLLQFAGAHPKDGRFGKSPESLLATRDAWLGWWKEKGGRIDLAAAGYTPRVRGLTDVIEWDPRGYGQGRVVGLGPDGKEKWRIPGVNNATDVRVAPNGNVWVVEMNNGIVTERTPAGAVVTQRNPYDQKSQLSQPINLDLLPDGGVAVVCRNGLVQWDKDGKQSVVYKRPNNAHDVTTGRRLPTGETVLVTNLRQNPGKAPPANVVRVDDKGNEVKPADADAAVNIGYVYQIQSMGLAGEDRVLVCRRETTGADLVAEYDLKTGKQTWKYDCPQNSAPSSAQRLPNGNTLICLTNANRLIEVDPSGEVLWEYQAKDGLRVARAYRR